MLIVNLKTGFLAIILFFSFQLCEDLFTKISDNTDNSMSYSVEVRVGSLFYLPLLFVQQM